MKNGYLKLEIHDRALSKSDVEFICKYEGQELIFVKNCFIEDFDIASTNHSLFFESCYFVNSEAILPEPGRQLSNCTFTGSRGIKKRRHPIRTALKTNGYYTPLSH